MSCVLSAELNTKVQEKVIPNSAGEESATEGNICHVHLYTFVMLALQAFSVNQTSMWKWEIESVSFIVAIIILLYAPTKSCPSLVPRPLPYVLRVTLKAWEWSEEEVTVS
jgi:hypothetical protein